MNKTDQQKKLKKTRWHIKVEEKIVDERKYRKSRIRKDESQNEENTWKMAIKQGHGKNTLTHIQNGNGQKPYTF